jgi:single-stranded-DNA-specific exonuclease
VLDRANAERQGIESDILTEALAQAAERAEQARASSSTPTGWHPGVIGIVASRVVERYHRPTVMVGVKDGVGKGSARSIEAFHLYDAISGCADLLPASAATSTRPASPWRPGTCRPSARPSSGSPGSGLTPEDLIPRCKVDAVVGVSELDERAVEALQRLGPFGQGNPEPVLVLRHQVARPRVLPHKSAGAGHLKLALVDAPSVDAIGFGMADRLALTEGPVDLAFQASFDTFRGQRRPVPQAQTCASRLSVRPL